MAYIWPGTEYRSVGFGEGDRVNVRFEWVTSGCSIPFCISYFHHKLDYDELSALGKELIALFKKYNAIPCFDDSEEVE